jgi:hypothetical protein
MRKASRGLGSVRIAGIALMGLMGIALCACGGGESGSSAAPVAQAATGSTSSPATGSSSSKTPLPAPAPAPTSAAVTLAWDPPTQNSDGTALTDLVGYKIHYGTASQDYTDVVELNNPGLTRYVVDSLPAGEYYFAVAAYNSKGDESLLSQEVIAALN